MAKRPRVPTDVQVQLFKLSKRRCCFCFQLENDDDIKNGQIAHVDGDNKNNKIDNLAWLCLDHHDKYDTRTSQSKGFLKEELLEYRRLLYEWAESNSPDEDIPGNISDLVQKVNNLQAQMTNLRDPLATIGALYGIEVKDLRDLLVEYASDLAKEPAKELASMKAILAAGQLEKAGSLAKAFVSEIRRKREKRSNDIRASKFTEAEALAIYGISLIRSGKYSEALRQYEEADRLVADGTEKEFRIRTKKELAVAFFLNGKIDLAIGSYMEALKIEGRHPGELHNFDDYYNLGQFLLAAGEHEKAEKFISVAYNLANKNFSRDDDRLAITLLSLSQVAMERKFYDKAEEIGRKFLGLLKETGKISALIGGSGFYNLAKILRITGQIDEAVRFYDESLEIYRRTLGPEDFQVLMVYNEIGLCELDEMEFPRAVTRFEKCISIARRRNLDTFWLSCFIANRGRAFLGMGKLSEARVDFEEALLMRKGVREEGHNAVEDLKALLKETEKLDQNIRRDPA